MSETEIQIQSHKLTCTFAKAVESFTDLRSKILEPVIPWTQASIVKVFAPALDLVERPFRAQIPKPTVLQGVNHKLQSWIVERDRMSRGGGGGGGGLRLQMEQTNADREEGERVPSAVF